MLIDAAGGGDDNWVKIEIPVDHETGVGAVDSHVPNHEVAGAAEPKTGTAPPVVSGGIAFFAVLVRALDADRDVAAEHVSIFRTIFRDEAGPFRVVNHIVLQQAKAGVMRGNGPLLRSI